MSHRIFAPLLTLSLFSAAHAEVRVSIDPLPFGSVQLSADQYMIPNVHGINVLIYSNTPIPFAEPGKPYVSKENIVIDPLPYGAVRMNDSQYLLKSGNKTIMLMANDPLAFRTSSLTMDNVTATQDAGSMPAPLNAVTPASPAAGPQKTELNLPANLTARPVPVTTGNTALIPKVGRPYNPQAQDALERIRSRTGSGLSTPAPTVVAAPTPTAAPTAPLTQEVRANATASRTIEGLPQGVNGTMLIREDANSTKFMYSIINSAQDAYILNPVNLSIKQEGMGLRASLDRRNGNLTPGVIPTGKGEMGTVTIQRKTNAPITMTWTMQNQTTGENYQLSYTY